MKRILFILLAVAGLTVQVQAQNCDAAVVTTSPANFTALDEVTVIVDVNGCDYLSSLSRMYLWIFIPDCCGPDGLTAGNGDFCNGSNPELEMTETEEGSNIWTYTFIPSELFARAPGEITAAGDRLGMLAKEFAACKGNGDQTVDLFVDVTPLTYVPSVAKTLPQEGSALQSEPVTLFFFQDMATDQGIASLTDVFAFIGWGGTEAGGNTVGFREYVAWGDVGSTPELQFVPQGDNVYTLTFIPEQLFGLSEGDQIETIFYKIRSADGGAAIPAGFDNFELDLVPESQKVTN